MEPTISKVLQQGVAEHKEGNLQEAERLYRSILQTHPAHPDANHNLGAIAVAMNQFAAALPLFEIAIESNPKIEQFWVSYIDVLIQEKRFESARKAIEQGERQGAGREKLKVLESHIATMIQAGGSGNIKTKMTLSAKRKKLAENKKKKMNKKLGSQVKGPPQVEMNNLLQHYQNGRYGEAERIAISITTRFPEHQFGWKSLGALLKQKGMKAEALHANQKAVQLDPRDAEAHSNLGNTLKELGRVKEAEASYRQAIVSRPDFAEAHYNLGFALQELGRLEEAKASYRKAIDLKPDFAEAHRHLTLMKTFEERDEQFLQMQASFINENCNEEQRCHLGFGLAKASVDLGEFEEAFKYYSEGNALRKKLLNYDISLDVEFFKRLKGNYSQIAKNSIEGVGFTAKTIPIFIVGMPRSGTTLVEQIISSHSQVTGAGELSFVGGFGESIASGFSEANANKLLDFRKKYLTELDHLSDDSLMVTDKMPQNFCYIGLLAASLPEAKIVHVKRNPAAVCWSNYKQHFPDKALGYSCGLDDILKYYALYEDLMGFWEERLPNRIYNIDYESLTVNQADETRNLIHYLGLEWERGCLSHQDNSRSVATASDIQVRKKIYQGSSQQWKNFKPFLNGVLDRFDTSSEK